MPPIDVLTRSYSNARTGTALIGMAVTSHTVTTSAPNSIIGLEELNVATFEYVDLEWVPGRPPRHHRSPHP